MSGWWTLRIQHIEPTYAEQSGQPLRTFTWTVSVFAYSEEEARAKAAKEFRRWEGLSGVGWVRQIVSIDVLRGPER